MRRTLESLALGTRALRANRLRTFLSTLGVIIGVGALLAILNLGDSLERYSRDQIDRTTSLGIIEVSSQTSELVEGLAVARKDPLRLTEADATDLASHLGPGTASALFLRGTSWAASLDGALRFPALITVTQPRGGAVLAERVEHGRFFTPEDLAGDVPPVVISRRAAERLARGGSLAALLGQGLRVGEGAFRIVGIQEPMPEERYAQLVVPTASALAQGWLREPQKLPQVVVRLPRAEQFLAQREVVLAWVKARFGGRGGGVDVSNPTLRHQQVRQGMKVFKVIMGCITGISLIVGGIGIMNVLLASVAERTREIGIRRAAGARRRDVLLQFLAESLTLSGLGGLTGLLAGWLASLAGMVLVRMMTGTGVKTVMTPGSALLAFGSSFAVGLLFGLYPAWRAARLSPTEAIRYE